MLCFKSFDFQNKKKIKLPIIQIQVIIINFDVCNGKFVFMVKTWQSDCAGAIFIKHIQQKLKFKAKLWHRITTKPENTAHLKNYTSMQIR